MKDYIHKTTISSPARNPLSNLMSLDWDKHPGAEKWRAKTFIGTYDVSSYHGATTWRFKPADGSDALYVTGGDVDTAKAAVATHYTKILIEGFIALNPFSNEAALLQRLDRAAETLNEREPGAGDVCREAIRVLMMRDAETALVRDASAYEIGM